MNSHKYKHKGCDVSLSNFRQNPETKDWHYTQCITVHEAKGPSDVIGDHVISGQSADDALSSAKEKVNKLIDTW